MVKIIIIYKQKIYKCNPQNSYLTARLFDRRLKLSGDSTETDLPL